MIRHPVIRHPVIRQLGLRARLTVFVTVVFAIALTVTSVFVVAAVEERLVADTRATAEAVLGQYLDTIYAGTATVGVVDPDATTRFFYLDAEGTEISERQYFTTIASSFDAQLVELLELPPSARVGSGVVAIGGPVDGLGPGALTVDQQSGVLSGPDGVSISLIAGPVPTGEPKPVDRGADLVAVAQTLTFADGSTIDVGVSNPLRPVTDSLDAFTDLLWFAVPALVAAIAAITWLAATRALRPVAAIVERADAITAANLDQRVPVHGAEDEIRRLGVTVNHMLDRLQRAQDRQRQLVADASHELRSPVAASRAQLEVAAASPATVDWMATAETVLAEQERLATLIDDLLALSRLDEAGVGSTADVDLDDLLATEAGRQPHPIEVTIGRAVRVHGNRQLLTRAVRNLLDNAARHADRRVAVNLAVRDREALIEVDDDGPGIPSERREDVFGRFTRLDEGRDRDSGGAGLGLAIARQVARAHAGDIVCSRSPFGGARLTLTIPRSPAEPEPLDGRLRSAEPRFEPGRQPRHQDPGQNGDADHVRDEQRR